LRKIGGIFGRSVFGPINEHMSRVADCVEAVRPLLGSWLAREWDALAREAARMHDLENAADRIKHEIRNSLSAGVFSAVERSEVMDIIKAQDDIADNCERLAEILEIRRTVAPTDDIRREYLELAEELIRTGGRLAQIVAKVTELFCGAGGGREELRGLISELEDVHRGEHNCGQIEHSIIGRLFAMEKELDALTVIFLWNLTDRMGSVAGSVENAADALRRMIGQR